jgi:hypothetical protein
VLTILMRREGARLVDLIGFDRARLGRDVVSGLLPAVRDRPCAHGWGRRGQGLAVAVAPVKK